MKRKLVLPAILSLVLLSGTTSLAKSKEAPSHSSSLNTNAVRSVVKSHMVEVQKCYTDLIIEGMATTGKVVVTWNVDDKGAVQDVAVKGAKESDQALSGCVTEKISSWTFPPAPDEKFFPVTYTFNFGG